MKRRTRFSRDVDPLWRRILHRYRFRQARLRPRAALVLRRAHAAALIAAASPARGDRRSGSLSLHVHLSWPGWWVDSTHGARSPETARTLQSASASLSLVQVGRADVGRRPASAAAGSPFAAPPRTRALRTRRRAPISAAADHRRNERGSSSTTSAMVHSLEDPSPRDRRTLRAPLEAEWTRRVLRSPSVRTSGIDGELIVRRRTELMTTRRQVLVSAGLPARASTSDHTPPMVAARHDRRGNLTGGGAERRPSVERRIAAAGPIDQPRLGPLALESRRMLHSPLRTDTEAAPRVAPARLYAHAVTQTLALAAAPPSPAASSLPGPGQRAQPSTAAAAATQPSVPVIDVARLSEDVYRHIQRKIRIERERRGL